MYICMYAMKRPRKRGIEEMILVHYFMYSNGYSMCFVERNILQFSNRKGDPFSQRLGCVYILAIVQYIYIHTPNDICACDDDDGDDDDDEYDDDDDGVYSKQHN